MSPKTAEDVHHVEPLFVEDTPLDGEFEQYIKSEFEVPYFMNVEYPESAPATQTEYLIGLARRILNAGGSRTGYSHHTEISQSLRDWAPEYDEDVNDDPGYWGECAFSLSASEINFGRLEGDEDTKEKKARTVIAWGQDQIGQGVLTEIEEAYTGDILAKWDGAGKEAEMEFEIRKFQNNPPDSVGGWHQFEANNEKVEVAYRANNHDVPVVVAVYEGSDGLQVHEWTVKNWEEHNGDPISTPKNRFPASTRTNDGPYARLRNHLRTYNAEPLPNDEGGDTSSPVSA